MARADLSAPTAPRRLPPARPGPCRIAQRAVLVAALATLLADDASAWGAAGHRWIAARAQPLLTPAAALQVERLLAAEPGATLATVSTWADDTRTPDTAAWHYVNLPVDADCHYDPPRDCPQDQCVVAAIAYQQRILGSTGGDGERLVALKYLVHLVADVHQPLHAGAAADRGGNRYQVRFGARGTNLHAVWDTGLIAAAAPALAERAAQPVATPGGEEPVAPDRWAEESCAIVAGAGFYPADRQIDDDYVARFRPILIERMDSAARRLAALLNQTLAAGR